MSEEQKKELPQVTVSTWPTCAIPEAEIRASLMYLAHKTGKTVRFSRFPGQSKYSSRFVNVYVCTRESGLLDTRIETVRLDGKRLLLPRHHLGFSGEALQGKPIMDEDNRVLGFVDQNCIVIRIEITGEDNQVGRTILSHVVEKAVPLLSFDVDTQVGSRQEEAQRQFREFFSKSLAGRLEAKRSELTRAEAEAQSHYQNLLSAEQEKIVLQEELDALDRFQVNPKHHRAAKQAKMLIEMEENGLYEEVHLKSDGSVKAVTGEIVIDYAGWTFPMGRYEVQIDAQGKVMISALKEHPQTDYPHPHVSDSGAPCLGNIHADVGRAIGQFRIAEALQVLHQFLCSYEPGGAYVKIGKFDETGQFEDPDDDPCEDCDDRYSPYCIWSCEQNNGWYTCSDCNECRTEYCYDECHHNDGMSPCDDCPDIRSAKCFTKCPYNDRFQRQDPCDDFCKQRGKECAEYECKWFKQGLETANDLGRFDPAKAPEFVRDYTQENPEDEPNPDWEGGEEEVEQREEGRQNTGVGTVS